MNLLRFTLLALAVFTASASLSAQPPKDNFGDPLPEGAKARIGTTRMHRVGGGAEWMGAALTPNGKELLAAVSQGAIDRISVATGRSLGTIGEKIDNRDGREQLKLSAYGTRGMSVVGNETVVWDAKTGREINRFRGVGTLSANGKLLVFGDAAPPSNAKGKADGMGGPPGAPKNDRERDGPLTAVVWDVDKKEKRREIAVAETGFVAAILSPDGKILATWGEMQRVGEFRMPPLPADTLIQFWSVETGKKLGSVTLRKSVPSAITFSPDGKTAAVGNWGGAVLLVDPETGGTQPLLGDAGEVTLLAFSPDGKTLASGTFSGTVTFWDTNKTKEVSTTKCPARAGIMQIVFTGAGTAVAWGIEGSKAVVWEVPSGKLLSPYGGHSDILGPLAFTPDGKELLSTPTNYTEWIVSRWDVTNGKPLGTRKFEPPPNVNLPGYRGMRLLHGGTKVLAAAGVVSYIYDVQTGKKLHDLGLGGRGNSPFLTDDGKLTLTPVGVEPGQLADRSKPLKHILRDLTTDKKLGELELPAPGLQQATRTADGKRLVTSVYVPLPNECRTEMVLTLWDIATGKKLGEVKSPGGQSLMFAPGPDGKTVLTTDTKGSLRMIDLTTGKVVHEIDTGGFALHSGPVFSPNGKLFAMGLYDSVKFLNGPNDVRIYNTETGKLVKTFQGHEGLVSALAFSPDGKTLASGSHDTTILLWDLSVIEKK